MTENSEPTPVTTVTLQEAVVQHFLQALEKREGMSSAVVTALRTLVNSGAPVTRGSILAAVEDAVTSDESKADS